MSSFLFSFFFAAFLAFGVSAQNTVNINFAGLLQGAQNAPAPAPAPTPAPTALLREWTSMPGFNQLERGVWHKIPTGGASICALGAPHYFFVRPSPIGDNSKLLVEFQGGGACFSAATCSNPAFYTIDTSDALGYIVNKRGLKNESINPFNNWNQVFIPYCSGDLGTGNTVSNYGQGIVVNHKGAINVKTVLGWVRREITNPARLAVMGCSAGGFSTAFHYWNVRSLYPNALSNGFVDSAVGVSIDPIFVNLLYNANTEIVFPGVRNAKTTPDWLTAHAAFFPDDTFGTFSRALDEVQVGFTTLFLAGLPVPSTYTPQMFAQQVSTLYRTNSARLPNYRYFFKNGTAHCVLNSQLLASETAVGASLSRWIEDIANGKPVNNVDDLSW
eukprot:TRINITY_DN135_c0_g1_i2.p1 TRINITY_DN135_c0_g1~~TRINITY_DN135_c0_g1_i2.p1  ORF type:complete len:387 (+),score=135.90 TRINITY_DN135_c0_g1_i2:1431-2591(+)